jgi:hypothetical protein
MAQLSFVSGNLPCFCMERWIAAIGAAFVLETGHFWVSPYHLIIALPPGPMEMFYQNKFLMTQLMEKCGHVTLSLVFLTHH